MTNLLRIVGIIFLFGLCFAQDSISYDELLEKIFNKTEGINLNNPSTETTTRGTSAQSTKPTTSTTPYPSFYTTSNSVPEENESCGLNRECVPRHLCDGGFINTDGLNLFDVRIGENGDEITATRTDDCGFLKTCCPFEKKNDEITFDPKPIHNGCGWRNSKGVGFHITGDATHSLSDFGEFPWMVAISSEMIEVGQTHYLYECGGAIIAPNVIITGAHCVHGKEPSKIIIRAGEWDTLTEAEALPYRDQRIKDIIMHEQFNPGTLVNDVALLILEEPLEWQGNIAPLCLPPADKIFDFKRCITTGWGKDVFGQAGQYQNVLKKIELPVVPSAQCQTNLRTTRLGKYFILNKSFICAGGEKGVDACKGDGGSPLVCPITDGEDRYYHAGIVAWGIGCGTENVPGVYGNVAYFRPWLDEKLRAKGIDSKHYTP